MQIHACTFKMGGKTQQTKEIGYEIRLYGHCDIGNQIETGNCSLELGLVRLRE